MLWQMNEAMRIFELHRRENSNPVNAFDGLREGYLINGKFEISNRHYVKPFGLHPKNDNAKEILPKTINSWSIKIKSK